MLRFRIGSLMSRLLALAAMAAMPAMAAEVFIANPRTACGDLSRQDIQDILLGRRAFWPDGSQVVLVIHPDPQFTAGVLKGYAHKTPSQFNAWWKRQVFTGTSAMPPTASSPTDLLEQVASTPGAIAFIDAGLVTDRVKTVHVK